MSGRTVQMLTRTASGGGREGGGSTTGSGGGSNPVKLAGEESKDKLYEPKHSKKLVRVLTVVAYMFSVSLAAIMLSVYYVFLWNPRDPPHGPRAASSTGSGCQLSPPPVQYQQELKLLREHLLLQQQQQQPHDAAEGGTAPQFQPLHQPLEASNNVSSNLSSLASSTSVPHTMLNQTSSEQLAT